MRFLPFACLTLLSLPAAAAPAPPLADTPALDAAACLAGVGNPGADAAHCREIAAALAAAYLAPPVAPPPAWPMAAGPLAGGQAMAPNPPPQAHGQPWGPPPAAFGTNWAPPPAYAVPRGAPPAAYGMIWAPPAGHGMAWGAPPLAGDFDPDWGPPAYALPPQVLPPDAMMAPPAGFGMGPMAPWAYDPAYLQVLAEQHRAAADALQEMIDNGYRP